MYFLRPMIDALHRRADGTIGLQRFVSAGLLAAALVGPTQTVAQGPIRGRYFPLDQTTPPGVAAQWSTASRRGQACALQLIRVELPGEGGRIGFYTQPEGGEVPLEAPALAAIQVGSVYRLRISDLPEWPGVDLYPTVELIDRLHPPRGREAEFPVPITFTEQELRYAVQGRLVTKVVYLEQPDRATAQRNSTAARTRIVDPRENVLAAADEAGRPMAIVRLGGRVPDPHMPEPGFFGLGAPIQFPTTPARIKESSP